MSKVAEVKAMVEAGKTKIVPGLVQEALDAGCSATEILTGMIEAMNAVGDKFSAGEIFVPEMLVAAKAMSKGVEVLKPHLAAGSNISLGTCVIGTVQGDLHDIGKNLVAMMLEGVGFEVVDLGVDVAPEKFLNTAKEKENVKIVALSGLLTTTMPAMRETVSLIKNSGLPVKVIVGGAPVTQEMADEYGADGFAPDAGAAAKARELVGAQ